MSLINAIGLYFQYALGGSYAVQWLFAAVSIVGFFFALFFLPETHGKKLKDIEDHFMGVSKKRNANEMAKNSGNGARRSHDYTDDSITRSNSNRSISQIKARRGERKISRTSLSIVPEMEQLNVKNEDLE